VRRHASKHWVKVGFDRLVPVAARCVSIPVHEKCSPAPVPRDTPALRSAPGQHCALPRAVRSLAWPEFTVGSPPHPNVFWNPNLRPATGAATLKAPRRASEPVKAAAKAAESAKPDDVLATAAVLSTQASAVRKAAPGLAKAMRMVAATRPPRTDPATVA
jgi:hypothetical protein